MLDFARVPSKENDPLLDLAWVQPRISDLLLQLGEKIESGSTPACYSSSGARFQIVFLVMQTRAILKNVFQVIYIFKINGTLLPGQSDEGS